MGQSSIFFTVHMSTIMQEASSYLNYTEIVVKCMHHANICCKNTLDSINYLTGNLDCNFNETEFFQRARQGYRGSTDFV